MCVCIYTHKYIINIYTYIHVINQILQYIYLKFLACILQTCPYLSYHCHKKQLTLKHDWIDFLKLFKVNKKNQLKKKIYRLSHVIKNITECSDMTIWRKVGMLLTNRQGFFLHATQVQYKEAQCVLDSCPVSCPAESWESSHDQGRVSGAQTGEVMVG